MAEKERQEDVFKMHSAQLCAPHIKQPNDRLKLGVDLFSKTHKHVYKKYIMSARWATHCEGQ